MPTARLLAILSSIVCVLLAGAAAGDSHSPVTIRSYNSFGLSATALRTGRTVAQAVLRTAGVDARWRECRTAAQWDGFDPCDDVLARHEMILRIVRGPGPFDSAAPLGDALVETHSGIGVLATIFADRILSAGARTGADSAVLLGRAIAHEVGHLLMGSAAHSTRGLMRARWSDDELRIERERDWRFSRGQMVLIRTRLNIDE